MATRKKSRRAVRGIVESALVGSVGSVALGAVGGPSAVHGQKGISRATSFLPAMGTVAGAGMLMDATHSMVPKKRRRRK